VKFLLSIIACIFLITPAHAGRLHKEAAYRDAWCIGQTEVKLEDGTRGDCITTNYAVEVEFAQKWAEGIGQSLHYARLTGKKPAILMIIEKETDWRYYKRALPTARKHNIRIWYITPKRLKAESITTDQGAAEDNVRSQTPHHKTR